MAEDYQRIAVPEQKRAFFSFRLVIVVTLVVLVAVWLRQNVQPEGKPTMRLVHETPLRAVDVPPDYARPSEIPEVPLAAGPSATVEEIQRAFEASDQLPPLALPPPPDSPADLEPVPYIEPDAGRR